MSATTTTKNAQTLLARMLRVAKSYKDYNVREYLVRRTNDTYELNKERPEERERESERERERDEREARESVRDVRERTEERFGRRRRGHEEV